LLLKFHREEGMVLICTELSHNSIELKQINKHMRTALGLVLKNFGQKCTRSHTGVH